MTGIELLRKYAETRPAAATCRQLPDALGKECDDFGSCNDCHRFVCNAIADQIEHEMLPRTRFEDGKIARIGEVARYLGKNRTIANIYVTTSGYHRVLFDDNVDLTLRPSEMLQRPVAKVLDADGVEFKVGDEVWMVRDGDGPWIVESVDDGRVTCLSYDLKLRRYAKYNVFTHKRPEPEDSWEQIEADASDDIMVLDFVRRCKALAKIEED